jgi:hypothetical protein
MKIRRIIAVVIMCLQFVITSILFGLYDSSKGFDLGFIILANMIIFIVSLFMLIDRLLYKTLTVLIRSIIIGFGSSLIVGGITTTFFTLIISSFHFAPEKIRIFDEFILEQISMGDYISFFSTGIIIILLSSLSIVAGYFIATINIDFYDRKYRK